jgi:geranylgeranyl diphosphate synthase, type II
MKNDLSAFFDRVRPAVDQALAGIVPPDTIRPSRIHEAMRYSTLDGGKRIRPCLCVAAYSVYKDDWKSVLPVAAAIELIHSYSLIHDDLPAMDDDDLRRGKPSCHKRFGEAIAILAGDALLTLAFEVLARCDHFPPERVLQVTEMLARASGTCAGMIAGQVLDLEAEGSAITTEQLEMIHRSKTGALIGAAVRIGAYLGGASKSDLDMIAKYCDHTGLAFQIVDDILDFAGEQDLKKATYPAVHGLEKSRAIAHHLMNEAKLALAPLGGRAHILVGFCDFLEHRTA